MCECVCLCVCVCVCVCVSVCVFVSCLAGGVSSYSDAHTGMGVCDWSWKRMSPYKHTRVIMILCTILTSQCHLYTHLLSCS